MQVNNPETFLSCIIICAWSQFTKLVDWSVHAVLLCHRHRPLCSAPVFGGNRSNCAPWRHGNGNLHFSHCWDPNRTSCRPQVRAAIVWQQPWTGGGRSSLWLNLCVACDSTESFWAEKNTGPSCCPPRVSRQSCSLSSCPGSPRVLATSILTERMRTVVRKVNLRNVQTVCNAVVFDLNQGGWEGSGVFWSSGFQQVITLTFSFGMFSLEIKGLTQSSCVNPAAWSDEMGVNRHVGETPVTASILVLSCVKPSGCCTAPHVTESGTISRRRGTIQQVSRPRDLGSSSPTALSAGSYSPLSCWTLPSSWMASMRYVHEARVHLQTAALRPLISFAVQETHGKAAEDLFLSLFLKYFLQIYFYTNYLFQQAGIPSDKIPYVTIGTGACECITALTCVSICGFFAFVMVQAMHQIMMKCSTTAIRKERNGCGKIKRAVVWLSENSNECVIFPRGKMTLRNVCFPWQGFVVLWPTVCASQGFLIESLGRRVLIAGGYTLMSICCILFTLTLTFQVSTHWSCKNKRQSFRQNEIH